MNVLIENVSYTHFERNDDEDSLLLIDPSIPEDFIEWAKANEVNAFKKLIVEGDILVPPKHYSRKELQALFIGK